MATATSVSLNIEDQTRRAPVAPVDLARLMYYLDCISGAGPRNEDIHPTLPPPEMTDHANYQLLTFQEIRELVKYCRLLTPENRKIKEFVFCDTTGEVCKDLWNPRCAFINVSADYDVVSVGQNSIIAGSVKGIGERMIMFYTPRWLEVYYTNPLKNVSIFHCLHCNGTEGYCACKSECDRPAKSRCHILRPNEHVAHCCGCKDELYVTGVLYCCTVCTNYGLCRRCYVEREVDDLTHPYDEIVSPGATPRRLTPRKAPLLPPPPIFSFQPIPNVKDLAWEMSTPDAIAAEAQMAWGRPASPAADEPSTAQSHYPNFGLESEPLPTMKDSRSAINPSSSDIPQWKAKAPFRKDDMVVLNGLTRADMNGKEATVLSVDVMTEKAQVRIAETEKTFKVKWVNMEVVEELEDTEDELE